MKIFDLLKNMGIIAIGGICTKVVNFLLIPLYTSLISVEEYGTIDLLITITTLLVAVVSFQAYEALFKFATIKRNDLLEIQHIFTNIWLFSSCMCILYSIFCICILVLVDFSGKWYILFAVISTIFLQVVTKSSRSLGHNALYSFCNFASALVTIVLNILFLVVWKWEAFSILYAYVAGPLVGGIICVFGDKLWRYVDFSLIDLERIKEYLCYSFPLIPNEIAWWAIHASDRVVIATFMGVYATGLLAIATKFSLIYSTVFSFFYASWVEQCFLHYRSVKGREHIGVLIPKIFMAFSYFTLFLMVTCMYIYPFIIDSAYSEAYTLIPWYLVAVLLNVIVGLVSPVYLIHNETKKVMYSTVIAGLINIVINILTVTYLGTLSAPIAAIVGYGSVAVWRWFDVQKRYLQFSVPYKQLMLIILMLILAIELYYCEYTYYKILFSIVIISVCGTVNFKSIYRC